MEISTYKLIFVDDDVNIHKLIHSYLNNSNIEVKSLYNPEEIFNENLEVYDAVIIDYYFKEKDITGLDLLKKIRNTNYYIIIIMITSYSSEQLAIEAIRYSVDDFLIKPINFRTLASFLQGRIEGKRNRYNENSEQNQSKNIKIFENLIILNNSIPIFVSGTWLNDNKEISSKEVMLAGFLSAIQTFSTIYFGQSLNELTLNKENLLFYKENEFIICLRLSNEDYRSISSINNKKLILNQMKEFIEYVSISNVLSGEEEIPLNVKNQINKLIKLSNKILNSKTDDKAFTSINRMKKENLSSYDNHIEN